MNWYAPYIGAGIKVTHLANDFSSATVEMGLTWYNRNYVGVQFGGSLCAMIDPFYMLLIMNQLGNDYVVWDKEASIEFVKPGTGRVRAHFEVPSSLIIDIQQRTQTGDKYLPQLTVKVVDELGEVVAIGRKTLYIRRKRS